MHAHVRNEISKARAFAYHVHRIENSALQVPSLTSLLQVPSLTSMLQVPSLTSLLQVPSLTSLVNCRLLHLVNTACLTSNPCRHRYKLR